jgi:TonB family protein
MTAEALFVDAITRVSLVLALALAAAALLRHRSAAVRHRVLAAAILCASATPLLTRIVPRWGPSRAGAPEAVLATLPAEALPQAVAARPAPGRPGLVALVAPVWIGGSAVSLLLLLAGFVQLARIRAGAHPVTGGLWRETADGLARAYGLRRPVVLLQVDRPSMLMTWGAWRPRIVLPLDAGSWAPDRVRIVLAHELAHVARGDWAVHIAAAIVRAAFWFNPLVWIACRRLADESERACDDHVLALGVDGRVYAGHLVELARAFTRYRRGPLLAAPAPSIVKSSSLERRVRAMLQFGLNRNPISRSASAAIVVALAAVTVPLAGFGGAQSGPAVFTGTLVDAMGRILPDVPVEVKSTATAVSVNTRTDAAGTFTVANLAPGEYELSASLPGFGGQYRLTLGPGTNVSREIPLQLGTVQETINVRRDGPPSAARPPRPIPDYHPETDPCRQSQTGGCVAPPLKLRDVKPIYPPDAATGAKVALQGVIGTDGTVQRLAVVDAGSTDPRFAQSALAAVAGWQFTPTRLDGITVETHLKIAITFVP